MLDLSDPNVNPTARFSDINTIFSLLFRLAVIGGFILFVAFGLYGAYLILTAGENSEQVSKAQKLFTFSIIGIILVVTSIILSRVVGYIFKIEFPF